MTFFGLKWGQDLENRAAHPHQEFPGVPPLPGIQGCTACEYSRRSSLLATLDLPWEGSHCRIQIRPWDKGDARSSRPLDKEGGGGAVSKKLFRPFRAQFGLKIRGSPGPPENLEAQGIFRRF